MAASDPERSCCGPFAQKIRRLQALEQIIHELRNRTPKPGAGTPVLLKNALEERDVVRKWLLAHHCKRESRPSSGRASRFESRSKRERLD